MTYLERLAARTERVGSCLCLGIDPHPDQLPEGYSRDIVGVEAFGRLLIEAGARYAAAIKVNLAFFEAFGSAGLAALERLRAAMDPDVPFIADAKRGDIGSTAVRHAAALFDGLGADAVTASPYMGRDAIEPLLAHGEGFVYVLCRTSNPSAAEVQALAVDAEPLYARVARMAVEWDAGRGRIGLVVGATAVPELELARSVARGLPFLVPGVGAQGGEVQPVMDHGPARERPGADGRGGGLLVNVSRGIAGAATDGHGGDIARAIEAAAAEWSARLQC